MLRSKGFVLLCFVFLIVCVVITVYPGRKLVQLSLDHHKRDQWVVSTYKKLLHAPQSTAVFAGDREDIDTPSAGHGCGTIIRVGLFATNDSFSVIKEYYKKQFAGYGWREEYDYSTFFSFAINQYSRVVVSKMDMPPTGVSISLDEFHSFSQRYETIYAVEVRNWSSILCPE